MADLQTLSLVLTGIGLIIALIYYTLTLRNTNRTRQADMLMRLHSEWGNKYHQDAARARDLDLVQPDLDEDV